MRNNLEILENSYIVIVKVTMATIKMSAIYVDSRLVKKGKKMGKKNL